MWELDTMKGPPFYTGDDKITGEYHHSETLDFHPFPADGLHFARVEFTGEPSKLSFGEKDVIITGTSETFGRTILSFSLGVDDKAKKSPFYRDN